MTKSDDKRVPVLRFKGFTDEWEQRKLGEISNIIAGGDKNINKIKKYGKYPVIANSINKNGIVGYYDNEYRVKAPAVTVTGRGEIGHAVARFQNFTPIVRLLALSSKLDPIFLANSINKIRFFNESTGVPQLTKPQLSTYSIIIPSVEEQNNIGKLILLIEKYIHLQQRKLERLKSLKKAYLRLIFNTSESIHYLKDIAEYRRGSFPQPYTKREWYGGKDSQPFVQVADVNTNLRLFSKTKETISKKAQQNSVFVPKDTIVVTLQGSIGRVAITQYDSYVDRTLLIITKLKKRIDKYYLAYALQEKFNIEKRKAPGGTIKTITKSTLSNFAIILPNFEKQSQQSQTLKTIDNEIYLINKKLDKLVQFKQFLLQNMFI